MFLIIFSFIFTLIFLAALILSWICDITESAILMAGFLFLFVFCDVASIIVYKRGDIYKENSHVVKVMNNDPSIKIDTLALDKNGKIKIVRIKEK